MVLKWNIIKVEIELYKYDELNEEAKEKAYIEHYDFLSNAYYKGELEEHHFNTNTEKDKKELTEDSIRANEYFFFSDGKLASCVTYTGKHEKAGITELKFQNKVYEVV